MTKKLLVTDIDGTITHLPNVLDDKVVSALYKLFDDGWQLFFLTGRYFTYASKLFTNFSVPYLLGCQNGASVWSSETRTFLYSEQIQRDIIEQIEKKIEHAKVAFSVEAGAVHQDAYYRMVAHDTAGELKNLLDPIYFSNSVSKQFLIDTDSISVNYPYPFFSVAKLFGTKKEIDVLYQDFLQDEKLTQHVNMVVMRWPFDFNYHILFMAAKNVSKGSATQRVIEKKFLGEKPFIMASGDDMNDLSLIKIADFKIVMQTAPNMMHAYADFLAPSAENFGILPAWEAGSTKYQEWIKNF